jgi:regulator of cell morphogenesis and NO signaling
LALISDELQGHQHKEEAALFPMMRQGGAPHDPAPNRANAG